MDMNVARLPVPAILFALATVVAFGAALGGGGTSAAQDDGFSPLLTQQDDGTWSTDGWTHHGPGHFELDAETGQLTANGGMGLFYYSASTFSDFELALEFRTSERKANSGVFVRVPEAPDNNDYIHHSFEVQIDDAARRGIHRTGAVYDAEASAKLASNPPGEWNRMRIRFVGDQITVWVNDEQVVDWAAEPRGKIRDFAAEGYIGLQNHDEDTSVTFRNLRIKDLSAGTRP